MPIAAIFDVDGTLTATTGVDDECFVAAIQHVLGVRVTDTDWGNYTHSTDQGLTEEICQRGLGRRPAPDEIAQVKRHFIELLRDRIGAEPHRCQGIAGVTPMLDALRARAAPEGGRGAWRLGIASGAWPEGASTKLGFASVSIDDLAQTFSHALPDPPNAPATREQIITQTIRRLETPPATRIVYIGDGVWDARAARAMGIGFVGVATGTKRERLEREGVQRIIPDYRDLAAALRLIEEA